ncbi:MAG: hypothetical protein JSS34_00415 [Proteobacteria bacterium]|nr:hypothetical protein [Pseudomonadota bacterium]
MISKKLLVLGCLAIIGPVGNVLASYCCDGPNSLPSFYNGSCVAESEKSCNAHGGSGAGQCQDVGCYNDWTGESF